MNRILGLTFVAEMWVFAEPLPNGADPDRHQREVFLVVVVRRLVSSFAAAPVFAEDETYRLVPTRISAGES
jgi:hypothetical protein